MIYDPDIENEPTPEPTLPKHTAVSDNPENNNFLSPLNFKFILKRAPHLNFFLQKIIFPSLNSPGIKVATPFVDIWHPSTDVEFGPLDITFMVDEDLKNWHELYIWKMALGEERSLYQYQQLWDKTRISGLGIVSDIVVHILNSQRNPNYTFYFHDCFPVNLGSMVFDVTPQAITHQTATATFRYTNFDIEKAG